MVVTLNTTKPLCGCSSACRRHMQSVCRREWRMWRAEFDWQKWVIWFDILTSRDCRTDVIHHLFDICCTCVCNLTAWKEQREMYFCFVIFSLVWPLSSVQSWDLVHVLTICGVTVEIVWFNLFRYFDKHMHNLRYRKWHCGRCRVWLRINRWGLYSVSIVI